MKLYSILPLLCLCIVGSQIHAAAVEDRDVAGTVTQGKQLLDAFGNAYTAVHTLAGNGCWPRGIDEDPNKSIFMKLLIYLQSCL